MFAREGLRILLVLVVGILALFGLPHYIMYVGDVTGIVARTPCQVQIGFLPMGSQQGMLANPHGLVLQQSGAVTFTTPLTAETSGALTSTGNGTQWTAAPK